LRVAAIDIGTNSVLLLVAERRAQGDLVALVERAHITRLGQGVDASGTLAPGAVERTLLCLAQYAEEIRTQRVDALDVVGTSALRDVSSGAMVGRRAGPSAADFIRRAGEILGVVPRVVSGDEEALLAFAGGMLGLNLSGEVSAFDVGGGSTEVIDGRVDQETASVRLRRSIDVGSVRLFERHVRSDPPRPAEMAALRAFVLEQLAETAAPAPGRPLVGMAGTVTSIAAVAKGIDPYDPARVHGTRLGAREIAEVARRLGDLPLSERRKVRGLDPNRADVIPVGAAIVEALVQWSGATEVIVSDRGVRWGVAAAMVRRAGGTSRP